MKKYLISFLVIIFSILQGCSNNYTYIDRQAIEFLNDGIININLMDESSGSSMYNMMQSNNVDNEENDSVYTIRLAKNSNGKVFKANNDYISKVQTDFTFKEVNEVVSKVENTKFNKCDIEMCLVDNEKDYPELNFQVQVAKPGKIILELYRNNKKIGIYNKKVIKIADGIIGKYNKKSKNYPKTIDALNKNLKTDFMIGDDKKIEQYYDSANSQYMWFLSELVFCSDSMLDYEFVSKVFANEITENKRRTNIIKKYDIKLNSDNNSFWDINNLKEVVNNSRTDYQKIYQYVYNINKNNYLVNYNYKIESNADALLYERNIDFLLNDFVQIKANYGDKTFNEMINIAYDLRELYNLCEEANLDNHDNDEEFYIEKHKLLKNKDIMVYFTNGKSALIKYNNNLQKHSLVTYDDNDIVQMILNDELSDEVLVTIVDGELVSIEISNFGE